MDEIVKKPKQWLKRPRHGCTRFNEAELRHLADNIEVNGLFNPIDCLPDGEIISGFHRWMAVMLKDGITEVPVRIVNGLTGRGIRVRRMSENLLRVDLGFYDKYLECRGFIDDEPGITCKEIAAAINMDASTITRYLCLDHCVEAVKQAAKDELIGMKVCYEISKEPSERQPALLAAALAGGAALVTKQRKRRVGNGAPVVRASKIRIPLANETATGTVTVAGDEIDLEDAEDLLKEALKAIRSAKDKGLNSTTAQKVWKEMAAAGGGQ